MTCNVSRRARLMVLGGCGALALAAVLGGCAPSGAAAGLGLEIAVCEVRPPAERAAEIDAAALSARATSLAELCRALEGIGPARVLYHAYQVVSPVSTSRIRVGARAPFVTAARATRDGQKINTVEYQELGAMFDFSAAPKPGGADALEIRLAAELSAADAGAGPELGEGVKAPVTRHVSLKYIGAGRIGRPLVLVTVDASSGKKDAAPVAYVCRVALNRLP